MLNTFVRRCFAVALLLISASQGRAADAVADFYRGKTVFLQVGGDVGGGHDVLARIVARTIGKHIPGSPNVVVQDVPGGGSLVLANQFGNTTARDGTVFGITTSGTAIIPLLAPQGAHFDARKFNFLGSPSRDIQIFVVWHDAPVKTVDDIFTKELIVGASAPGGGAYDYPVLTNAVLGTRFKIVKGYVGGGQTRLALQRGEIQGNAALSWSAAKTDYRQMLDSKDLLIIAQYGFKKDRELTEYPLFPLGTTEEQHQLFRLMYSGVDYGRPFMMPPDVPADRLAAMRQAFADTMVDPDFVAEMSKLKLDVDPVSWRELQDLTATLYDTPASVLKRMQDVMGLSIN
jgi:tripartite-type tricarboxylate transporter receptor subunit TctC